MTPERRIAWADSQSSLCTIRSEARATSRTTMTAVLSRRQHMSRPDSSRLNALVGQIAVQFDAGGLTLAVAESCTGGSLAAAITERPGVSSFFLGGVVSYANEVKESMLSVPEPVLAEHGAVSEPTARAMAEGVRKQLGADVGVG